jgi:hypothetical protein
MLLGNGVLEGSKVLERETVDAAFTNQIGKLDFPAEIPTADPTAAHTLDVGPGYKWGYGLLLNSQDVPCMRRALVGRLGRNVQHVLLGRPHHRHRRLHPFTVPAIRASGSAEPVRRFRAGTVRFIVSHRGGMRIEGHLVRVVAAMSVSEL